MTENGTILDLSFGLTIYKWKGTGFTNAFFQFVALSHQGVPWQ